MVPENLTIADTDAIRADLEYMTARWGELSAPAVFEVRAFKEGAQPQSAKFSPDWIDEAVDWCESMNGLGFNIYAVRNPIRHDATGSAKDTDIIAAFFLWADCDDPASAGNVKRFDGPKYSAAVTTGRTPSVRVHVYWQLEQPCTDMAAWRDMQTRIAAHFNSDRAVVNPSRIMRVGGTVAYPAKHKLERGYAKELTTIRTEYDDAREPVTMQQMDRVFASAPQSAAQPATGALAIDTGPQPLDRALAAANIMAGTDWRENVKKLVASYVARGWTDDEIVGRCLAFTLPGWTQEDTAKDVAAFIKWTREQEATKGGQYAVSPETTKTTGVIVPVPSEDPFEPWEEINPLAIPRREFIYGRHYIRKFASVTVAPGGLGKSTLVLAECIAIATGRNILGVQPASRERVVYYNAEDPKDEIQRRVLAMLQHHGIDQSEIAGWLFTSSGRDRPLTLATGENGDIAEPVFEYIEAWGARIGPAVYAFDPLANMTESPETNDVFRRLGRRLSLMADRLNSSIEIVHHTRKLNGRDAEIEDSRGGGALLGSVRAGRVLNPMSPDESVRAGLETHIDHFRIEAAGKNNLARPAMHAEWFRRVDVEIPNGDHVAAVEVWEWPDAFDGVSADDARKVQIAVGEMEANPPRENVQAKGWVGHVIGRVLGFDTEDKTEKERIKQMVRSWVKTGVLSIEEMKDDRTGRDVKVVFPGPNNPASNAEAG